VTGMDDSNFDKNVINNIFHYASIDSKQNSHLGSLGKVSSTFELEAASPLRGLEK
jgi:hypothetical protein